MGKKISNSYSILSVLLLVLFFTPWTYLPDMFHTALSGANIPPYLSNILRSINSAPPLAIFIVVLSYCLYLIPVLALTYLIGKAIGRNDWFLRLNFLVTFIAILITCIIQYKMDPSGLKFFSKAFYIMGVLAFLGMLIQMVQFLFFRKSMGER